MATTKVQSHANHRYRPGRRQALQSTTRRTIMQLFKVLDYAALGPIYCDEGGERFWKAHWRLVRDLGLSLATILRPRLSPGGRSLYVGAGVAELPLLAMETLDLQRQVSAYNLRHPEVMILNRACQDLPFTIEAQDAQWATGQFDHIWIVSVLNDPERFPHLSALSYGRANPLTFDATGFEVERTEVRKIVATCLSKLTRPGLITTSVEERPWIQEWCHQHQVSPSIDDHAHPTAIVGDPVCFLQITGPAASSK